MKEKIWKALAIFAIVLFAPFAVLFVYGSLVVRTGETLFWLALGTAIVVILFKAARS